MIISEERKAIYKERNIDLGNLKLYYVNRAKCLIDSLTPYTDDYATELKETLKKFINNPNKDLIDVIDEVKTPVEWYNSFSVNNTLFDICYVENELIDFYLGLCEPKIPVMDSPKPLTDKELDVILNNPKATDEKKELVREAKRRKVKASAKSGIHLNRLFPIIDFETKNISFWFD